VTGADQFKYPRTAKKKQRVQTGIAASISVGNFGQVKKEHFFARGGVFSLDPAFNG